MHQHIISSPRVKITKRSKGDRSAEPWEREVELIFDTGSVSAPPIHCCHFWKGGTGRRDASCYERQCQGRRGISKRHSGIVPVKYKHSVAGKTWYPLPLLQLQPSSLTFPVSPTYSQYGLFHPVGGSTSFFVHPHLSCFFFSSYLLYHSQERSPFLLQFSWPFLFLYT